MNKVLYTKYSTQRRKEFQIATSIIQSNETKYVVKRALYAQGVQHLNCMQKYYADMVALFSESGWRVVQGDRIDTNQIKFNYVNGRGLEEELEMMLEQNDYTEAVQEILRFFNSVLNNSRLKKFVCTKEFEHLYGKVDFETEKLRAFAVSNVDLMFSNFFIQEKEYTLIDYEWIFPFPIPIEYIFFRSLFHSVAFQRLPEQYQIKVYRHAGINNSLREKFMSMEYTFQRYVKGECIDLNEIYKKIGNKAISLPELRYGVNLYKLHVDGKCVLQEETVQSDIAIRYVLRGKSEKVRVELNHVNGIYKLKTAQGIRKGKSSSLMMDVNNASLQILNDYYFVDTPPSFTFIVDEVDEIIVEYSVLERDNALMPNLVKSLLNGNRLSGDVEVLQKEKESLETECHEYKEAYAEYKEAYEECSNMLENMRNELESIHQELWWKVTNRLRNIIRRGN